jgi:hypothetical protein
MEKNQTEVLTPTRLLPMVLPSRVVFSEASHLKTLRALFSLISLPSLSVSKQLEASWQRSFPAELSFLAQRPRLSLLTRTSNPLSQFQSSKVKEHSLRTTTSSANSTWLAFPQHPAVSLRSKSLSKLTRTRFSLSQLTRRALARRNQSQSQTTRAVSPRKKSNAW